MLKIAVAAPFRHLRKAALKKSELVYYYALDRKWMNTEQAAAFIRKAEESGLLTGGDGVYKPSFDYTTVTIPVGFRPTSAILERSDPFTGLVNRIAQATGREETEVVAEMNKLIREGFDNNLAPEAAIAVVARRHNVPFGDYVPVLLQNVKKG
jgi:hypothetical protein